MQRSLRKEHNTCAWHVHRFLSTLMGDFGITTLAFCRGASVAVQRTGPGEVEIVFHELEVLLLMEERVRVCVCVCVCDQ